VATVLHTMQQWLPLSEQFVHALVTRSRHRGVVVSRNPIVNREAFPHRPVIHLPWLFRERRPPTLAERRYLTAALMAIALAARARLVHHHHAYRLHDVHGVVVRLGLPLVVSCHGHDVAAHARAWPGQIEPTLRIASAVVVPSRFLVPTVVALGVPEERVRVIPSGVDTAFFTPTPLPAGPPTALFVGRFVEKKGLDVLLEAWPRVVASVPEARLRILGHGPLEPLARSGGPGVEVELTDPRRRAAQVRDAIRAARVVVTPSRTASDGDVETLLLVNLEAQASARPVVTTRHGGIPEYVEEDRTALLVPERDPAALADALVAVLRDDALARRLGEAGPAVAARHSADAAAARIDALYEELLR
jgi:colanic acid/amylovoran biosynthesis glycosyltransferase